MEIVRTESGDEVTLKISGCLDTAATPQFAAEMEKAATAGAIVLDMSSLEFISSSALRQLVAVQKRRGSGLRIVLVGMNEVVREVFSVTGLDEVFEVRV